MKKIKEILLRSLGPTWILINIKLKGIFLFPYLVPPVVIRKKGTLYFFMICFFFTNNSHGALTSHILFGLKTQILWYEKSEKMTASFRSSPSSVNICDHFYKSKCYLFSEEKMASENKFCHSKVYFRT